MAITIGAQNRLVNQRLDALEGTSPEIPAKMTEFDSKLSGLLERIKVMEKWVMEKITKVEERVNPAK